MKVYFIKILLIYWTALTTSSVNEGERFSLKLKFLFRRKF